MEFLKSSMHGAFEHPCKHLFLEVYCPQLQMEKEMNYMMILRALFCAALRNIVNNVGSHGAGEVLKWINTIRRASSSVSEIKPFDTKQQFLLHHRNRRSRPCSGSVSLSCTLEFQFCFTNSIMFDLMHLQMTLP